MSLTHSISNSFRFEAGDLGGGDFADGAGDGDHTRQMGDWVEFEAVGAWVEGGR